MGLFKVGPGLFRLHEVVVLDALSDALPSRARSMFQEQIAAVRRVQRLHEGREVNMYAARRGAAPWPHECAFPNQSTETRLATVRLTGTAQPGRAVVYTVRGHIFQLQFGPSPREMGDLARVRAVDVTVHADPLEVKVGTFTTDLLDRVPPRFRAELEACWAAGRSNLLLARDDVYEFNHGDATYLMLAQLPDTSFVALRLDPIDSEVRRFETDGALLRTYDSIRTALSDDA